MRAILKSLELKRILKNYYIKITVESEGKEYILSKPLLSDAINFNKYYEILWRKRFVEIRWRDRRLSKSRNNFR